MKSKNILFIIIILFIILFILICVRKRIDEKFTQMSLKDYQNLMLNNNEKRIYKLHIKESEVRDEQCFQKCNEQDCIKMESMKKNLKNCMECYQKGKCFKKSVIGGNCDDCMGDEKPIDCLDTKNFGCTNYSNFNSFKGSPPYFFELQDYSVTSPFDQKCVFCWQIPDLI